MQSPVQRKRIAIIGAGASGMATAWSLSRYPDKYEVDVIEPGLVAGGVACTFRTPSNGVPVNYGVQGGSVAAHQNTVELMRVFGCSVADCRLDVSFGKGKHNWKNYEAKALQEQFRPEIARFGRVLRWISWLEMLTIFVSIDLVLRVCAFSDGFRHRMVYPIVALFFGTGNQTPKVSAAIVARVFLDKSLAIFDYDPERLLSQTPNNIAFEDLQGFYERMRGQISGESCRFHMGERVVAVERSERRVRLHISQAPSSWRGGSEQPRPQADAAAVAKARDSSDHTGAAALELALTRQRPVQADAHALEEVHRTFEVDEVVFACPANVAAAILGKGASFLERRVLNSVQYYHDLSVTHTDESYMRKLCEVDGRAIYFIAQPHDGELDYLEMGFELSAYQPALKQHVQLGGEKVFQTIFLDGQKKRRLWTISQMDPKKVLDAAWWCAFSHTAEHFRWVVPWVWTLQGRSRSWFAGSWTLFNTHDIAIASGLAVAERLGAPYPFKHNPLAAATYRTVVAASHLKF